MLRSFLIYFSKAAWARNLITNWGFAWRAASRFVSGETLEDGIRAIKTLNDNGIFATLDHLGEHTTNEREADRATQEILDVLDAIQRTQVQSNVSIKLTQIGMALDEGLCAEKLFCILSKANQLGIFVRIDMEDSQWVDHTLRLYRQMRYEKHLQNVGVVIQSYLYRSQDDVQLLMQEGAKIRLCKGAYKEPHDIAFPKKSDVDASYNRLAEMLLDGALLFGGSAGSTDGKIPPIPAIATHDEQCIQHAKAYAEKIGLPNEALEFQMLYGIRRDLQHRLVQEGYPVRVYVPYGTEWYPYYMRRLAERPANVWFFLSNLFRQ